MKIGHCLLMTWRDCLTDLVNLFYPPLCLCCGRLLVTGEQHVCLHCLCNLPFTRFHLIPDNPIEDLFAGKIAFEHASASLFFEKGGSTRTLIHALKYHHNRKVGFWLGQMAAQQLKEVDHPLCHVDCIIPVPLHQRRQRQRGYNQSLLIAEGMSSVLDLPVDISHLKREVFNDSQTRLQHYDRWLNVKDVFAVTHPDELRNKHILLIDDVVTTGATLLAGAETLIRSVEGVRISLFAIATAYS